MKRQCNTGVDKPLLKRRLGISPDKNALFDEANAESLPVEDVFRSRIAAKLQMLLETANAAEESLTDDKDKKPDLSLLMNSEQNSSVSSQNFINSAKNKITELIKRNSPEYTVSHNIEEYNDHIALPFQNFINSAKSQITELLNRTEHESNPKELPQEPRQDEGEKENNQLENTCQSNPEVFTKGSNIASLQTQISLKLQSVLCKDNRRTLRNGFESNSNHHTFANTDVISNGDWQNFSDVLVDFLNSAKSKFTRLLSKDPLNNLNPSTQLGIECGENVSPELSEVISLEPVSSETACRQLTILPTDQQCRQNMTIDCSISHQTYDQDSSRELPTKCHSDKTSAHCELFTNENELHIENILSESSTTKNQISDCTLNSQLLIIEHSYSKRPNSSLLITDKEPCVIPAYIGAKKQSCGQIESSDLSKMEHSFSNNIDNAERYIDERSLCNGNINSVTLPTGHLHHQNVNSDVMADLQVIDEITPEVIVIIPKPSEREYEVIDLIDDEDDVSTVEESYKCPKCEKVFRAESLLRFHIRMHDGGSPLLLNSEPKIITKPNGCENVNREEALYSCSDCSLKFSHKGSLKRHCEAHIKISEPYKRKLRKNRLLGVGQHHKFCNACKGCF